MINSKKGDILMSNVVFILLVILFFSALLTFIVKQSSEEYILEEQTAKKLALAIDSAKPGMQIIIDAKKLLKTNEINEPIRINGNIVYVKLTGKTGYGYSFFNNVKVEFENLEGGYIKLKIK